MTTPSTDSASFEVLTRDLLQRGLAVRFQARGASMSPCIRDHEVVYVTPVIVSKLRKGDIVLTKGHSGFRVHRLVFVDPHEDVFITRGDCGQQDDPPVRSDQILGIVLAKEVRLGKKLVRANLKNIGGKLLQIAARGQSVAEKLLHNGRLHPSSHSKINHAGSHPSRTNTTTLLCALTLLCFLLAAPYSRSQVTVDSSSSKTNERTGTGTKTVTFNHTSTTTLGLLVVGVSINITNAPTTGVVGVTYNGTALLFLGAHNDAANTRRVEMWYLLNPVGGNNQIIVSVNIPVAQTVGIVAGATTFSGVDQTVPLGPFVSADGANGGFSQLDLSSVVNGMIMDTLAIGGNQNINTIPGPQVAQWNVTSGGANDPPDATASGSTRTGAPSVPISEIFSGNTNWALAAVSINPSTADIGVTTSVATAVFLGQNTTYTTTVSNSGPSAANSVVLTDTWPASMAVVSITPSAGTTCTAAPPPITCTLPASLASGATATVTVVATAATSGSYADTATVTDSNTPPDPNTGNNTYVAVATVQSVACAGVSQAVPGNNLTSILNTYYPGTASVAAGAKLIPVGAATGAGAAIAAGNLLLVIQMQDASINDSNTVAYGNGSTGQGFTALNSAGDYEFVTATGAIAGGSIPVAGAGSGGGLVFAYHSSAVSATAGQSTYQVIVVPQYTTASFSAASPPTALAWNGSTGGVLVLDTSSTLTLNGATVSVSGQGFRGGAGMQFSGGVGGSTADYLHAAPATYTGALKNGVDAVKGEGIAGTPLWVESGGTYSQTTTSYPSGTAGVDGSSARGAPGNAGGGGTDGDPTANDQNAGGGGGSNGGAGGFGGDSWNSNLSVGGEGGTVFPATINRVAMGGGGGAGTRNNSDGDVLASSGSAGGGIIILRTYALSGTGTLTANGLNAYNGTANDAGGGAGAGGAIVVLSANGGESGVTLQANGGRGGDAWDIQAYSLGNRHGPGGGGGGGVVLISAAPASISVAGGSNGLTLNPGVAYGATSGTAGTSATNATISQTSGTQSGAQCTPDVTLGKSHVGNFTRGSTAGYTVPVTNLSPYGPTSGTVTVNDTLPVGLTPTSATGTGWSCFVASQTVSCVDPTVQAANSSYPSITITANVLQTAPSVETNTALVSGGGEINLANDSATDVATVVSSADLSLTNLASPDPVTAGNNITYTQVLTNSGPSAADNAQLTEAIPANSTFVSISAPTAWNCVTPLPGATGNVVCTALNMAGSTAATFSLVTKVNAGTANGTVITDTATASSSVSDPNSANNSASASTVVGTTAMGELTVTNAASPNPVVAGNNITYTQVVTNTGTGAATAATFNQATPANTSLISITAPGWICSSPPISCTNATVAAGASTTFTAVYKVTAGTSSGTIISDTATVNAGNQAFGANSATATDVVASSAAQADVALTTVATPLSDFSGNDITYIQTVTNNGPAAAAAVNFTEAIPANTTFVSVSAPVGWSCTTTTSVVCTDASLASGASADIIVVANVASAVAATTITANSSVSTTTSDPNPANNSTTITTPVTTACDIAVTNSGAPSPVSAGSNITYTQVVTNSGPSNCSTATFTEPFPANTTFVSLSPVPAGWTCTTAGSISCTNPTLAPGSSSTFPFVVNVNAGTAAGTIITDTATVTTTTRDTTSTDNSATVAIGVASAIQADLSVTNSASPNPVNAGSNITYTQTVTNAGPAVATTVSLAETLPANTTFVSLSGPAGWSCTSTAPYSCSIATLAAGTTTTNFTFVVNVSSSVSTGTTITQTDSVTSATGDPNSGNNSVTASIQVADSADLSLTNTGTPVPVLAGNNITYTQVVNNAGPSTATSASLSETTPANTTFFSITPAAGWSCTTPAVGASGAINCTNPSDAVGTATFTVVLKVTAGTPAGTAISNPATVTSSTTDPNAANNSATANDVVATATQADLITTNSASPTTVAAGSNVTYTQSVTNNGPAAATAPSFTQTTPPNTNFQSVTAPAGWTCTTPAVGSAGTINCTAATLALNATAGFTLVLQVNAGTASGTNIAETDTASATNIVPNLTTNSATALVVVANANSADMAIVKTATPSPNVADGDTLLYTLAVTNIGPASATNVTVTDPLPSNVTFLQTTTTQGTCSEANGTVTCLLGTMANAGTATVTVLTLAGAPGSATNTATVSADQTDPILSNNSSTQVETITAATSIKLQSFAAQLGKEKTGANRVSLIWKTGSELHNLGFNVYREQNGNRGQLNSSLIAGSALLMSGALPKHSGKTYTWIDSSPGAGSGPYWLEDVDVNGTRVLHGPVAASSSAASEGGDAQATSALLNQLNQAYPAATQGETSHPAERIPHNAPPTLAQHQKQFELAAHPAVKIFVKHEGWYRVTQPDLIAAGLDPNVDPALLHLYAEALDQPVQITGATAGPGGFGSQAAINFYGTGIDTQYSGTRVYFLAAEQSPGQRVPVSPPSSGSNQPPPSFPYTVELAPRTTYFSALTTSQGNNFFGPLISSTALDETMQVAHLDSTSSAQSQIEVILQGVILAMPHDVTITLNGSALGDLTFTGQAKGRYRASLPPGLLQDGANTLTFTSQDGEYDLSLLQSIRIEYPHSYLADSNQLIFTGHPGDELKVSGFTQATIGVFDITNPNAPVQLTPQITQDPNSKTTYSLEVQAPWSTTNPAASERTLVAIADDRVASAVAVRANHPSHWHQVQSGSEIVMVSAEAFSPALAPLVSAHKAEGKSSAVVLVGDLYDEFNFGQHSPLAIRDFLQTAVKNWHTAPRYLLLNGRASFDPRNYLGFGHLDFVPTKIIPTTGLMTASDDWFSDFTDSGLPTIATGRFPVSTATEAELVASKVATYEGQSTNGPWTSQALMVADVNDTENFSKDSQVVQAQLPTAMQVTDLFANSTNLPEIRAGIVTGINSGQLLVNYSGHGSEDMWSGDDLFDNGVANLLTNGNSLPVFLIMNCLNGSFQDVYEEPLAVTLMLVPNGGAVAVLASSGLNQATPQTILDKLVVQAAMGPSQLALGDAIVKAKSGITDLAVRATYNLLGDPAMQIKLPAANPKH